MSIFKSTSKSDVKKSNLTPRTSHGADSMSQPMIDPASPVIDCFLDIPSIYKYRLPQKLLKVHLCSCSRLFIYFQTKTVREIIQELSSLLPEKELNSISRYHIYMNGLQFMNEDRPISSYVARLVCLEFRFILALFASSLIPQNSTLILQRGEEYEFVLQKSPETFCCITDITNSEASKQLAAVAYPKMKSPGILAEPF